MHEIYFYRDKSGKRPVADYLAELANRKDKDGRIKLNKIRDYVKALSQYGTQLGKPYIKHIHGDIWELRPISDRIFFVGWMGGSFVLLLTPSVCEENPKDPGARDCTGKAGACRLEGKGTE